MFMGKRGQNKKSFSLCDFFPKNFRGQVTIFIIIAILIVAGVALFFILRGGIGIKSVPAYAEPVYTDFLSCLEGNVLTGIDILETQGGYINLPEFEAGSAYSPFSSQLNFLGNPIPYWYYVSGNNIPKEQVPTKERMENDLEGFVEDSISRCSFEEYYSEGYGVYSGSPSAQIKINSNSVDLDLDMNLEINLGEESTLVDDHDVSVDSNLGKLYDSAVKVYEEEQEKLFLEEYAVDTLRLYAPVDGVELSCSPEIWNAEEVFDELQDAIEINTFSLNANSDDYYDLDLPVSENVRFINSKNWSNGFEVNPSDGVLMIAEPVGNQEGLGILGFCYVPHHFVYNVKYPVLIQVYDDYDEVFQFPVAVVLEGNNPRKSLNGSSVGVQDTEICQNKNTPVKVNVYDSNLNYVEADVSFECFGASCQIGKTSDSEGLEEDFPQCVNGHVVARADGFMEERKVFSSVNSDTVNIVLSELYEKRLELNVDGTGYNGEAVINFVSDDYSKTVVYPEQRSVEIPAGDYEVTVYVYEESSLDLGETTYEQCVEVPRGVLGGLFGLTQEKCFEVEAPSQIISSALSGGGTGSYYFSEQELKTLSTIEINSGSLETPENLGELQENYMLFETKEVSVFTK